MVNIRRIGTVVGVTALLLGSFTMSVTATTSVASADSPFKACLVTDTGGIHDRSFNASAWQGLKEAKAKVGNIAISYLSSSSSADYAPNIQRFIGQGCDIIVTVGSLMDAATESAADANPNLKFAIVDDAPVVKKGTHVLALRYEADQASFLGGILAAGMSKTGIVATYGGENISPVTLYMNGFVAGVRYYDQTYKKKVNVLGWKPAKGTCSLTTCHGKGYFVGNFTDQTAGEDLTRSLFAKGADIVFPVAEMVGVGSIAAAQQAGPGHGVLWVDSNGCVLFAAECRWFVGTVAKGVESSVQAAVISAANGTFKAGSYVGTLQNKGVQLDFGGRNVPSKLRAEIAISRSGVIAGTISVNPNKYPASK